MGLLWPTWYPLVGQRSRGDGADRRGAEGGRQLLDGRWRRQGDQEESERQAGVKTLTSGHSVSIGRRAVPPTSHSISPGNSLIRCKRCSPYSSSKIKIASLVKQARKNFLPCSRGAHKSSPYGRNGRPTRIGHPKRNGMTSGIRSRYLARKRHLG